MYLYFEYIDVFNLSNLILYFNKLIVYYVYNEIRLMLLYINV